MVITSLQSPRWDHIIFITGETLHPKWLAWRSSQKEEFIAFSSSLKYVALIASILVLWLFLPIVIRQGNVASSPPSAQIPKFCGFCCLLTLSYHLNFNPIHSSGKTNNKMTPLPANTFTHLLSHGVVHGKHGYFPWTSWSHQNSMGWHFRPLGPHCKTSRVGPWALMTPGLMLWGLSSPAGALQFFQTHILWHNEFQDALYRATCLSVSSLVLLILSAFLLLASSSWPDCLAQMLSCSLLERCPESPHSS